MLETELQKTKPAQNDYEMSASILKQKTHCTQLSPKISQRESTEGHKWAQAR